MFRAMFSLIFRGNLTVYTASVQCTDLLPTGDTLSFVVIEINRNSGCTEGAAGLSIIKQIISIS
jgi:hypothetical protein